LKNRVIFSVIIFSRYHILQEMGTEVYVVEQLHRGGIFWTNVRGRILGLGFYQLRFKHLKWIDQYEIVLRVNRPNRAK